MNKEELLQKKELINSNAVIMKNIIVDMLKYSTKSTEILESDETKINLFKKINFTFQSLSKLIKILLLQIDDEKYQMANKQKIIFPSDLDTLIVILGTFDRAFNHNHKQLLFDLVSFPDYEILYRISNINSAMFPFVIDDKTDYSIINDAFIEFNILVTDFACDVLNLNTEYEPHIIVDIDTQEHSEEKTPSVALTDIVLKDPVVSLKRPATDADRQQILKNIIT